MKGKFKIGQWVAVNTDIPCLFYDDQGQRQMKIVQHDPPYAAQIVGACTRMLGKYIAGHESTSCFGSEIHHDWEQAYMEVSQVIEFWLVRRGMTNKPIMVRDGDCEAAWGSNEGIPWKWTNPYKWTDKDRQLWSQAVKGSPRDKKGRWVTT